MRKSISLVVGVFLFVLVFSFSGLVSFASSSNSTYYPKSACNILGDTGYLYENGQQKYVVSYFPMEKGSGVVDGRLSCHVYVPADMSGDGYMYLQQFQLRFELHTNNSQFPANSGRLSAGSCGIVDSYGNVHYGHAYMYPEGGYTVFDLYFSVLDLKVFGTFNVFCDFSASVSDSVSDLSNMAVYNVSAYLPNGVVLYDDVSSGSESSHLADIDSQTAQTNEKLDNLTNGFDTTQGDSVSGSFSNDASSYEQAEGNIFTSAKNDLNSFQFYDIGSNSSVLVGLSFVSSYMSSIFGAMGGMTGGAGIVLSVLFSVMLVSIVIGTYRYFVSSGKTGKSSSRKGG